MTEPVTIPYALVPEWALLEELPGHIHSRFLAALACMHQHLPAALSWQQIARNCAISPFHFHRQFSELFNETPGQYLSRLRVQHAVSALLQGWPDPTSAQPHSPNRFANTSATKPLSVTDIALQCGYSSSQALAKALKRETGLTASAIRAMAQYATPAETALLLAKLAHPGRAVFPETTPTAAQAPAQRPPTLEWQLAQAMPTVLMWYPQRGYKKLPINNPDWDYLFLQYGGKTLRMMVCTPATEFNLPWQEMTADVGDWQCAVAHQDHVIEAGYFLCCEVKVVSDTGYCAALQALFQQAEQQQLSINPSGQLLEMVRQLPANSNDGVVFSLQLPVLLRR